VEGQGEIGLDRLLIEALRMSPDRIAVGEVRGSELVTMLDALNTGHSGAGATIHANSLAAVASRLLTIGARAGMSASHSTGATATGIVCGLFVCRNVCVWDGSLSLLPKKICTSIFF
jgi:pilus assembly protein CpaF